MWDSLTVFLFPFKYAIKWLLINTFLESNSFLWHPGIKTNKKSKIVDAVAVQSCPRGSVSPGRAPHVVPHKGLPLAEACLAAGEVWEDVVKQKKKQLVILSPHEHIGIFLCVSILNTIKGPHCPYFVCAFQLQVIRKNFLFAFSPNGNSLNLLSMIILKCKQILFFWDNNYPQFCVDFFLPSFLDNCLNINGSIFYFSVTCIFFSNIINNKNDKRHTCSLQKKKKIQINRKGY